MIRGEPGTNTPRKMRRTAVGIIALILLAIAGYGFTQHGFSDGDASFLWSSCWRIGMVLGAAWLALPKLLEQKTDASPLVLALAGLVGAVIVIRPRAIMFLWPIIIVLAVTHFFRWLIKPPPGAASARRKKKIGR